MGLVLTDEDKEIIKELRVNKVLERVDAHKINAPSGFMAFLCSDCDHIRDKFEFLCKICADQAHLERVHLFACHSGGMLLSPSSPTRKGNEHELFKLHIADAMAMKTLDLLITKCHAPCGAAYAHGLNFNKVLRHAFEGKKYVKEGLPELRVAVFAQIHFCDENLRRTYAVTGKKWWKYAERKNLF